MLVEKVLNSADSVIKAPEKFNRPTIQSNGEVAVWREKIEFTTGHRLEVLDCYSRRQNGTETRNFSYHFMDSQGRLLFRLDTHGTGAPIGRPCHLHVGEEIIQEGDPRLGTFSLVRVDFPQAFRLANGHINGKKFPWE